MILYGAKTATPDLTLALRLIESGSFFFFWEWLRSNLTVYLMAHTLLHTRIMALLFPAIYRFEGGGLGYWMNEAS